MQSIPCFFNKAYLSIQCYKFAMSRRPTNLFERDFLFFFSLNKDKKLELYNIQQYRYHNPYSKEGLDLSYHR